MQRAETRHNLFEGLEALEHFLRLSFLLAHGLLELGLPCVQVADGLLVLLELLAMVFDHFLLLFDLRTDASNDGRHSSLHCGLHRCLNVKTSTARRVIAKGGTALGIAPAFINRAAAARSAIAITT